MVTDSDGVVYEFLDFATRFTFCFPVPLKRRDDVLVVFEMVWINLAGLVSNFISDICGEFEGELT